MTPHKGKLRTPEEWARLFDGRDAEAIARILLDSLSGFTSNQAQDIATTTAAIKAIGSRWAGPPSPGTSASPHREPAGTLTGNQ